MLNIKPTTLDQWQWDEEEKKLENPKFGYIQLVDVCEGDKVLFQQPIWPEGRGEVNVIVSDESKIAFVEQQRHGVIQPASYLTEWKEAPDIFKAETGVIQLELPRGFTQALLGEVEEETRYRAGKIVYQTNINANTSLFATSPFVMVTRATKIPTDTPPDPMEKIRQVVWLSPEEINKVQTLCSFTHSALRLFRLWALKQEGLIRQIGERL
ncbi:hypothetical protein CL633_01785 [bacterium]|nr:hypothetical protein [bacterium]|tara:strand:+ start:3700 stop:4332 length:633 start_codon:yes stop_codon:yes gene_type:complete